jgi:hypothetical protein
MVAEVPVAAPEAAAAEEMAVRAGEAAGLGSYLPPKLMSLHFGGTRDHRPLGGTRDHCPPPVLHHFGPSLVVVPISHSMTVQNGAPRGA